jgi:uridine kinase
MEEIIEYFITTVEPMHQKFIESTKQRANLIIINELQQAEFYKCINTFTPIFSEKLIEGYKAKLRM